MGNKNKKGPTPPRHSATDIKVKELEEQVTSFGLCLSSIVVLNGEEREDGDYEYVLRLEDFQKISNANVEINTEPDIDGEPGTRVLIKLKRHNGSN